MHSEARDGAGFRVLLDVPQETNLTSLEGAYIAGSSSDYGDEDKEKLESDRHQNQGCHWV